MLRQLQNEHRCITIVHEKHFLNTKTVTGLLTICFVDDVMFSHNNAYVVYSQAEGWQPVGGNTEKGGDSVL